jgi:hypothetical protein
MQARDGYRARTNRIPASAPPFLFQVCDSPDNDSPQSSPEDGVSVDHRILKRVMPSNVEPTYKETDAVWSQEGRDFGLCRLIPALA